MGASDRFLTITASLLVVLCGTCGSAIAGDYAPIPPGNSAADQYAEGMPSVGGSIPVTIATEVGPRPSVVPGPLAERLKGVGPDGVALLSLLEATSPVPDSLKRSERMALPLDTNSVDGEGGPTAVVRQAFGGSEDGIGVLLPVLLLAVTFAGLAFALRHRLSSK